MALFVEGLWGISVYYKDDVTPSSVAYTLECDPAKVNPRIDELIDLNLMYLSSVILNSKTANKASVKFLSCDKLVGDDLTICEDYALRDRDGYEIHTDIPVISYDRRTPVPKNLRDDACCSKPGSCQGCFTGHGICLMKYYVLGKDKQFLFTDIFERVCRMCVQDNCVSGTCRNGEFADMSALKDPYNDLIINNIQCKPCAAGTWNTCTKKDTCYW